MTPVAAVCPVHGPFRSRFVEAINSSGTLEGNMDECPKCQRPSRVMEGSYAFDETGLASVLAAPQWSVDALEAVQRPIREAAERLTSDSISDATLQRIVSTVVKEVRRQEPGLASKIQQDAKGKTRKQLVRYFNDMGDLLARIQAYVVAGGALGGGSVLAYQWVAKAIQDLQP